MSPRPHVTVVGLGPAGADLLGNAATHLAAAPGRAYLRTVRHPSAEGFEGVPSFDHLYEAARTFDEVYAGIVEALVTAATEAAPEPVVYAVPGSPLVAERSVDLLRADGRVEVVVQPALSFLDLAWAALGVDPLAAGVRLVDASAFEPAAAQGGGPFLVAQCWSRQVLSELKLAAPDDGVELPRPVLLHHLGLQDELVEEVDWWELDRTVEPDHLTSLYVPGGLPIAAESRLAGDEVIRLVNLMDTLREQCPWDRAQTHESLRPHLVEESYEVLDALAEVAQPGAEAEAFEHLEEELGDLLFQIVFHARLADEEGRFDLADVARRVHDKLVHRHPHVFGDIDADDAEQVVTNWEAIKKSEKGRRSVTEGIPAALPALMLATKLARKARAVGVEPTGTSGDGAVDAVDALTGLTRRAEGVDPRSDDPLATDSAGLDTTVGEVLFAVANLAQRLGVDAEQALRDRALSLRADILAAEGVPKDQADSR